MIVDLDARLSYGYAMNKMGAGLIDPRVPALAAALYGAL